MEKSVVFPLMPEYNEINTKEGGTLNDRLTAVEEDLIPIKRTCLRVENDIIPKLDALYEDRIPHAEFSRLSDRVEQNTHMLLVMKDVIIDHSGEIQHLKEVK